MSDCAHVLAWDRSQKLCKSGIHLMVIYRKPYSYLYDSITYVRTCICMITYPVIYYYPVISIIFRVHNARVRFHSNSYSNNSALSLSDSTDAGLLERTSGPETTPRRVGVLGGKRHVTHRRCIIYCVENNKSRFVIHDRNTITLWNLNL